MLMRIGISVSGKGRMCPHQMRLLPAVVAMVDLWSRRQSSMGPDQARGPAVHRLGRAVAGNSRGEDHWGGWLRQRTAVVAYAQ